MFGYCCKCGLRRNEENLEITDVRLEDLGEQAPCETEDSSVLGTALKASVDLSPSIASLDGLSQPLENVTKASAWQPPLEHRVVFEADLHRRETATKLLGAFRQMVDAEIFSAEPTPPGTAELQARHFCSDDTLLRHLMSCNDEQQKVLASLKATLRWRADFLEGKGIVKVGEGVAFPEIMPVLRERSKGALLPACRHGCGWAACYLFLLRCSQKQESRRWLQAYGIRTRAPLRWQQCARPYCLAY